MADKMARTSVYMELTYQDGDSVTPAALKEAFKANPNPPVIFNSDHRNIIGAVVDVTHSETKGPFITVAWDAQAVAKLPPSAKQDMVMGPDIMIEEQMGKEISKAKLMTISLIDTRQAGNRASATKTVQKDEETHDVENKVWDCKIGPFTGKMIHGADSPMREAVQRAYKEITGQDADVCFSGWGGKFTEHELAELANARDRVKEDSDA